jgi:hypothetical protein
MKLHAPHFRIVSLPAWVSDAVACGRQQRGLRGHRMHSAAHRPERDHKEKDAQSCIANDWVACAAKVSAAK